MIAAQVPATFGRIGNDCQLVFGSATVDIRPEAIDRLVAKSYARRSSDDAAKEFVVRSAIVWLVLGWCVAGWLIVGPRAPDQPLESGCTSEQRASDPSCEDAAPRALLGMALRVATWPVAYLTE